jgi:hypothetical protein
MSISPGVWDSISVKPALARGVNYLHISGIYLEELYACGQFEHARSCAGFRASFMRA